MYKAELWNDTLDLLYRYVRIWQVGSKWCAALEPHMLDGSKEQKLPPGQVVEIGDGDYEIKFYCPRRSKFKQFWAARPYFSSYETAEKMIMYWLGVHRKDLVKGSYEEAAEARRRRNKQLYQDRTSHTN